MDYIREMLNAGSRIMDTVNDAIERGDYSDLTKKITEEMSGYTRNATDDVRQRMNKAGSRYKTYTTYNVNRGPRNASSSGYRPIDIDLGTRTKAGYNQSRPGQQGGQRQNNGYGQKARPNTGYGQPGGQNQQQGRPNTGYGQPGGFWGRDAGQSGYQNYGPGTTSTNAKNAAGQNQNAGSAAGKFTGAQTGAGYNAGQAYDERRRQQNASWNYSTQSRPNNQGSQASTNQNQAYQNRGTGVTPFNQYKKNAGSGLLKQTAGVTGLFLTVPVVLTNVAAAVATGGISAIVTAAMFGAGAGVSGYYTSKGTRQRKLSKVFDKYSKIVGNAEYMTIEDLAEKAGEDPEIVQKNLDEMIELGMLPQLKFDQKKTTMMLTKNAYDQYLLAENSRQEREKEEAELDAQAGSAEARKVISEGEAFITKIKKANDLIPGEEMTGKLDQMERIVSKIFAQVKKDPSTAGDLRKFMNYYLPTTEKLLDAYVDLDKQPEIGENIPKTKREIEATVDTINDAFENLLDSLFEDVAWDISSDISVMKTMMEQDGLMKKGISDAKSAGVGDVVSEDPIPDVKDALNAAGTKADTTKEDNDSTSSGTANINADTDSVNHEPSAKNTDADTNTDSAELKPELKFGDE